MDLGAMKMTSLHLFSSFGWGCCSVLGRFQVVIPPVIAGQDAKLPTGAIYACSGGEAPYHSPMFTQLIIRIGEIRPAPPKAQFSCRPSSICQVPLAMTV